MTGTATTLTNVQENLPRLWHAWLSDYFDGGLHPLGGEQTAFPRASLIHDQGASDQPLHAAEGSGLEIHAINELGRLETFQGGAPGGEDAYQDVRTTFVVRARIAPASTPTAQGNSKYQCRRAATLLQALLVSPTALLPLARYGLGNLEVIDGRPLEPDGTHERLIRVRGELAFTVPS